MAWVNGEWIPDENNIPNLNIVPPMYDNFDLTKYGGNTNNVQNPNTYNNSELMAYRGTANNLNTPLPSQEILPPPVVVPQQPNSAGWMEYVNSQGVNKRVDVPEGNKNIVPEIVPPSPFENPKVQEYMGNIKNTLNTLDYNINTNQTSLKDLLSNDALISSIGPDSYRTRIEALTSNLSSLVNARTGLMGEHNAFLKTMLGIPIEQQKANTEENKNKNESNILNEQLGMSKKMQPYDIMGKIAAASGIVPASEQIKLKNMEMENRNKSEQMRNSIVVSKMLYDKRQKEAATKLKIYSEQQKNGLVVDPKDINQAQKDYEEAQRASQVYDLMFGNNPNEGQ